MISQNLDFDSVNAIRSESDSQSDCYILMPLFFEMVVSSMS